MNPSDGLQSNQVSVMQITSGLIKCTALINFRNLLRVKRLLKIFMYRLKVRPGHWSLSFSISDLLAINIKFKFRILILCFFFSKK